MAIPWVYRAFFLYIEPFATLVGAFYAWFQPSYYLQLTDASSAPGILGLPLATQIALRQLGNLYMCFAFNEAVVLRVTDDLRVWRFLLLGLLIADFGHLFSCYPLGLRIYYDVMNWNAIDAGNIGFVYCGLLTRISFFSGLGFAKPALAKPKHSKAKKPKAIKAPSTPAPAAVDESPIDTPTETPRTRKRRSKPKQPAT
ncbi:hypothetical protein UCRPC4_g02343 [Phaeomoniella chlamydospora]|uniref:DUF7704 domain-containing protein n=1 Tax=Phaeomoniella chlamydospora TaxID=158046 RepID=A0A0G2GN10_PHACM|nr:hypothetical protein UCRPC4_g02343 [Phaeomoniella chlamydospora]